MAPAPQRSQTTTWRDFIRTHLDVLAGTDFFAVEVVTWRGLVTYYVLFFLHLGSRWVSIAGITEHPDEGWMQQMARSATLKQWGMLNPCRYLLHDRDTKFCASFRDTLAAAGLKCLALPARSPNLNAFAERWVRSVREECLSKLILFGETSLRRALTPFHRTLSCRTESSRERQPTAVPCRRVANEQNADPPSAAANVSARPPQVLLPAGCMSFLTQRRPATPTVFLEGIQITVQELGPAKGQ